jgi:hypothetical protein
MNLNWEHSSYKDGTLFYKDGTLFFEPRTLSTVWKNIIFLNREYFSYEDGMFLKSRTLSLLNKKCSIFIKEMLVNNFLSKYIHVDFVSKDLF